MMRPSTTKTIAHLLFRINNLLENTPQLISSINATFVNEDYMEIAFEVDEVTIE